MPTEICQATIAPTSSHVFKINSRLAQSTSGNEKYSEYVCLTLRRVPCSGRGDDRSDARCMRTKWQR